MKKRYQIPQTKVYDLKAMDVMANIPGGGKSGPRVSSGLAKEQSFDYEDDTNDTDSKFFGYKSYTPWED